MYFSVEQNIMKTNGVQNVFECLRMQERQNNLHESLLVFLIKEKNEFTGIYISVKEDIEK